MFLSVGIQKVCCLWDMFVLSPILEMLVTWINSQGLFSSESNGPYHSEMQAARVTFDFYQVYLNDLSYLGNSISAPCQSFQKQFLLL